MKRLPKVWVTLCLIAVLPYLLVSLIRFSASQSRATSSNSAVPKAKATFQPYPINADTGISVVKSNGKVQINIPGNGGDPPIPVLRVLATVLQSDKTSNIFVVNSVIVLGGASSTGQLIYNRKKQMLSQRTFSTMAGVGITNNSTKNCIKITDVLLFNLLTKKPEATLWDLGGACSVVKPQKRRNNSS